MEKSAKKRCIVFNMTTYVNSDVYTYLLCSPRTACTAVVVVAWDHLSCTPAYVNIIHTTNTQAYFITLPLNYYSPHLNARSTRGCFMCVPHWCFPGAWFSFHVHSSPLLIFFLCPTFTLGHAPPLRALYSKFKYARTAHTSSPPIQRAPPKFNLHDNHRAHS